jgi:hypothetical protein
MAVRWKKGAAPTVVPGILVVIVMSFFDEREAIWCKMSSEKVTISSKMFTLDSPGDGLASVLMMMVSFSG